IGIPDSLPSSDYVFVIAGTIPNRKSTPVVDEWFGLHFSNGQFIGELSMEKVVSITGLGKSDKPNQNNIPPERKIEAESLRESAVSRAKEIFEGYCMDYKNKIGPLLDEEIDKLIELQDRHLSYQLSLFTSERKKSEQERKVEKVFERFTDWVTDTLEIENNPYLRIVAVFMGV
ncbi:MAG: ATP-dependent helicase, partial [Leptolinea sp.]|nr:ATP-dependent helicase [Leptolinea sp.]